MALAGERIVDNDRTPASGTGEHRPTSLEMSVGRSRFQTGAYPYYVLFVLFLAHCFNAIDRSIVNILVEPIRADLDLSDGQIGILSGLGFALFYSVLGVPIACWADRWVRKNILAIGLTFWSAMTAATGMAGGFWTMLLARIGVGAGEASLYPTAYPLITDYFDEKKRPRAMALFQVGLFMGVIVGSALAGYLADVYGWRRACFIIGLPGVLLALLAYLTVREPPRGMSENSAPAVAAMRAPLSDENLGTALKLLLVNSRFMSLIAAATLLALVSSTLGAWGPAFLMRVHGLSLTEVGMVAGPVIGVGGVSGTLLGGFLGSYLAEKGEGAERPLLAPLCSVPFAVLATFTFIFSTAPAIAFAGGGAASFLVGVHAGPLVAVAIGQIEPRHRSLAAAVLTIGQLLIGFGIGPTIVGILSDLLNPAFGRDALRYALFFAPFCVIAGWAAMFVGYRKVKAAGA